MMKTFHIHRTTSQNKDGTIFVVNLCVYTIYKILRFEPQCVITQKKLIKPESELLWGKP
jgi:hypothetical protein